MAKTKKKEIGALLKVKRPGLLTRFLDEVAAEHVEPERRSVGKGETRGFGKDKHLAALLSLTSVPVKEQAAKAQVSFGLLRKWRTESDFKWAIESHTERFINLLAQWIDNRLAEDERASDAISSLPLAEIAKAPISHDRYSKDCSDAGLYGDVLVEAIQKHFFPRGVKIDVTATGDKREVLEILDRIHAARGEKAPYAEEWQKAWELHAAAALTAAMDKITKPDRSEEDLKDAVFFIQGIREELLRRSPYWKD